MERSIIHHNDCVFRKTRQKPLFKPEFKQWCICCSIVLHGGEDLVIKFCSHNICSLKFPSCNSLCHFFAPGSIGIFTIKTRIYAAFIDISNLFRKNIFDRILIFFYFFRVLFFIKCRFFLRVIPHRFRALLTD